MRKHGFDVVTGAFGYSGRYIAELLLARGRRVRTLSNTARPGHPLAGAVETRPLCFDDPAALEESLRGADTLYNTYWVRFNHGDAFCHGEAVENSRILFAAARRAGVSRVVHVSITNPSLDSPLEYFSGKAEVEQALVASGISYAILRPAVLFGGDDILINNIAWMLRRFPVFALFGRGEYRLQPIHVQDLARLAVQQGAGRKDCVVQAIGPETFSYRGLVRALGRAVGRPRPMLSMVPLVVWLVGWVVSKIKRDVTITRAEVRGLMQELLYVDAPPAGTTRLTTWARENSATLGRRYASELGRRHPDSSPRGARQVARKVTSETSLPGIRSRRPRRPARDLMDSLPGERAN